MRLLWFNLATDLDDSILAFTSSWIRQVAARVDSIHVITMRLGRTELPENVRIWSVGKEKGFSEPRRALEFYRHLLRILNHESIDACFSHMIPIFSVMAAPVLKLRSIPLVTWYAHSSISTMLKLSHHLSRRMVSVNSASYPYSKEKLVTLGHGIDTSLFSPASAACSDLVLSVGRLSPIKNLDTLLGALARLRGREIPFRCVLVGGSPPHHRPYAEKLLQKAQRLGLEELVHFSGPVPHSELVSWYRRCAVHLNCSPRNHAVDKAPLEAMACGIPSLSSVKGYRETFGQYADDLHFPQGDAEDLTERLARLLVLSAAERMKMGTYLRQQVIRRHTVERLADRIVGLLREIST